MFIMSRLVLSILLIGLLYFCFSQNKSDNNALYDIAEKLYQQASQLATAAEYDESKQEPANDAYNRSIAAFTKFITANPNNKNDSLLLFARLKTGLAASYLDSTDIAQKNYLAAFILKQKLPAAPDSLLFTPYLYTGGIYYLQNQFDSALNFYKKAEQINDLYKKPLNESQRLYNRLGVMFYETGNYRQARNYFEKAITLTSADDINLLANYKINIASLLIKLEEYSQAETIYKSLLPYNIYPNEIYHNLGIIALEQKNYIQAINYLHKVNYTDDPKTIDWNYHMSMAWSGLNKHDSSAFYIQSALKENQKWNGRRKNISHGLLLKFQADQLAGRQAYKEAAIFYQQAIMEFSNNFTDTAIVKNPSQFTAAFSYINLFNTLTAKAEALRELYDKGKKTGTLEAALDSYRSAFKLAAYVEKTYNSDEARLFLTKIKHGVHSKPIDISLQLYELTHKKEWLEEAYLFDQRNKASILSLNLQENEMRNKSAADNPLIRKESSIKTAITRLSLKASLAADSMALVKINNDIRDLEIELEKTQQKINEDPEWQKRKLPEQIPSINELQKKLDDNTALLSYHLSENELLLFFITNSKFEYYVSSVTKTFFSAIDSLKQALQNTSAEYRYNSNAVSTTLYNALISPVQPLLSNINRLIIIPDDELHYLPLEALQNENKKYLVEQFAVQYTYSTTLLSANTAIRKSLATLAFAPFASATYKDTPGYSFSSLPASKEEVSGLQGKIFMDTVATKNNFLRSATRYSIIHLATHASVNNDIPSRSFIAFYPGTEDYKLYAQEIYDLRLDSTDLVILSACETGTGQLIKGEGMMSLSRAFAYAGCHNIITSLWKAEDKTTAFLTQRLHVYLNKGYNKDKALQQAKLDLLANEEIAPRFKTPNYWAYLLFIGNYQPEQSRIKKWGWVAVVLIVVLLMYYIVKRKA
jgi:CHAT domain-containing protein/tetratricopeptide (TPR) repeat protein